MRATGIVRRIDDLGRVVIPKEIRRTLRVREGDPMEIYTTREGEILLKKYSPIGELKEFAGDYVESLAQATGFLASIMDRDMMIAVAGPKKKEYEGKPISKEMEETILKRKTLGITERGKALPLVVDDETLYAAEAVATILCNGDTIGAVVLSTTDEEKWKHEIAMQLVQTAAGFLGRQLE